MNEAPAGVADFLAAIRAGERRALARAITLIESTRPDRQALGQDILEGLVGDTGGALRVGLTGPPSVGKSSFVEALGLQLIERGHRVAVLAVDPTSPVTGGSILGDKTRMERLAQDERAFIRPSPSGGALGGVAHRTREALLLCEAAGFDVVLVETVGIGQSEVAVRALVDFFRLQDLPAATPENEIAEMAMLQAPPGHWQRFPAPLPAPHRGDFLRAAHRRPVPGLDAGPRRRNRARHHPAFLRWHRYSPPIRGVDEVYQGRRLEI